jgi:toxin ParE1/3/4
VRVRYSETAHADIRDTVSYIAARNPRAATAIMEAIDATATRIGEFPYSAPTTDEPNIRMAPAGRFPYLIFYIVRANEVSIVRVLHGARRRPWETER